MKQPETTVKSGSLKLTSEVQTVSTPTGLVGIQATPTTSPLVIPTQAQVLQNSDAFHIAEQKLLAVPLAQRNAQWYKDASDLIASRGFVIDEMGISRPGTGLSALFAAVTGGVTHF